MNYRIRKASLLNRYPFVVEQNVGGIWKMLNHVGKHSADVQMYKTEQEAQEALQIFTVWSWEGYRA